MTIESMKKLLEITSATGRVVDRTKHRVDAGAGTSRDKDILELAGAVTQLAGILATEAQRQHTEGLADAIRSYYDNAREEKS